MERTEQPSEYRGSQTNHTERVEIGDIVAVHSGFWAGEQGQRDQSWWPTVRRGKLISNNMVEYDNGERLLVGASDRLELWSVYQEREERRQAEADARLANYEPPDNLTCCYSTNSRDWHE